MKVFLLRHTEAEYGVADPDRPLSVFGARMANELASLTRANPYYAFREIWCSPYLRARQTAAPFVDLLKNRQAVSVKDTLRPGSDIRITFEELQDCKSSVLVVGHNPHLTVLAARLLNLDPYETPLSFKKGALFIFKKDAFADSGYSLSAYLPPASLGLKD